MTVVVEHADHLVLANPYQLRFDWVETFYNNQPRGHSGFCGVCGSPSLAYVRNFSTYLGKIRNYTRRTGISRKQKERNSILLDTDGSSLYLSHKLLHVSYPFCCLADERIKTWV